MLTIVIPVLNRIELTRECIRHIRENSSKHIPIVIVDNGSSEDVRKELIKIGDKLIALNKNLGVIPAMNAGWKHCDTDYVMFMHNDLYILEKYWDSRVENVLGTVPNVGVAGFGGGDEVAKNGWRLNFSSNLINAEAHGRRIRSNYIPSVVQDGMCLIVRKQLLEDMGTIAKEYSIHHFYDYDLCLESIYRGYKVVTIGVSINHLGWQTSKGQEYNSLLREKRTSDSALREGNRKIYCRKWENRLPIHVDSAFNYYNARGPIQMK
ncbi:glycosyltransferase family 2 protein [Ammoniphilus sp. 3BR4]|uniref:glycosyltransferase family 2 protein n=1 Tax=Ammoniphilus sp. 3BR4 TaxID=3158265 RepID=UPI003467619D